MSGKRAPPGEDHPLKPLADLLRAKVDQADAKVLGGSSACGCGDDGAVRRFDYFRAKDAVRAMARDPSAFGLFDLAGKKGGEGEEEEEEENEGEEGGLLAAAEAKKKKQGGSGDKAAAAGVDEAALAAAKAANEALAKLVRAGLLFRAERRFQRPKPGRKRRVKWPRTLVPLQGAPHRLPADALAAILSAGPPADGAAAPAAAKIAPAEDANPDADTFYVWSYDKPTSWLFYVGAGALLLGCAAVPLYPLAPHPVRLAVLYLLLALLSLIVGTVSIRGVVFSLVWILTGNSLWLLPNLLSEEVPLSQVLKPLVSLKTPKAAATPRQQALRWGARAATGVCVLALGALLSRHGPSGGVLRKAAGEANDALLAYMETMAGGATKRLHNGTDESPSAATAGGGKGAAAAGGGSKGGGGGARAPMPPPPIPDEDDEDEEVEEAEAEDKFDDAREEEEDEAEEKKEKKEL